MTSIIEVDKFHGAKVAIWAIRLESTIAPKVCIWRGLGGLRF